MCRWRSTNYKYLEAANELLWVSNIVIKLLEQRRISQVMPCCPMEHVMLVALLLFACYHGARSATWSAGSGMARKADGKIFTANLAPVPSVPEFSPEAMLTAQKEARDMAKIYIDSLIARGFPFRQGLDLQIFQQFVADTLFNRKLQMSL